MLPLLNEERLKELVERVPPVPLKKSLLDMTCGEFIEAMDEGYVLRLLKARRIVKALGRYRQYLSELEIITNYMKRYEVAQTSEEKAAAQGVAFPSIGERILVESVRHYHLHSTAEAEKLPLADWLLCFKDEGSKAQYQHRLSEIQSKKNGTRKR